MRMIGLYGPMESGKDIVAEILRDYHGYSTLSIGRHIRRELERGSQPVGVAGALIPNMVRNVIDGMTYKNSPFYGRVWEKPTSPGIREALQWWGKYRREQDAQYWNKMLLRDITALVAKGATKATLSDLRMPAEYYLIQDGNGVDLQCGENWYVFRAACVSQLKYGQLHAHETEMALRNYPFKMVLANNGGIPDLIRLVAMVVREYQL